jgi:methylase of polypeptide subunit release factors
MATATAANPISDLMYDWLTVLHNKAEGLNAYEKYIKDAQEAGSEECVEMFRRLMEYDARMVQEVKDHVFSMVRDNHEATRS